MNDATIPAETLTLAQKALNKAKVKLMPMPDTAFFTTILFSLKQVWDNTRPTAWTDGLSMGLNTEFFLQLDEDERVFLLLHEVGHVVFQHVTRLDDRCPDRWNIAGDHVINLMWLARGFKMPKGGLADPQYTGMSTDEVYDLLPNNPGKPQMPDIKPCPGDSTAAKAEIDSILIRAAIQSKMAGDAPGTIPGSVQAYLDDLLSPKLPWNRILLKQYQTLIKSDYSWRKPNRRFFPKHYLPSMQGEGTFDLAFAIDMSGSVSDKDTTRFATEIQGVLRTHKPDKLTLLQFDTLIRQVDVVRSVDAFKQVEFHGRGGTAIRPVLEWAVENKPKMLLIFTDGQFHHCSIQPPKGMLVIWLIHDNPRFTAPYGKVVHYAM